MIKQQTTGVLLDHNGYQMYLSVSGNAIDRSTGETIDLIEASGRWADEGGSEDEMHQAVAHLDSLR